MYGAESASGNPPSLHLFFSPGRERARESGAPRGIRNEHIPHPSTLRSFHNRTIRHVYSTLRCVSPTEISPSDGVALSQHPETENVRDRRNGKGEMTKYVWVGLLAGLVECWRPAAADQATIDDDAIQRAFHPYPIEKPAPPSPRTRGRPRKTPYPRRFWTRSRQASSPSTSGRRPICRSARHISTPPSGTLHRSASGTTASCLATSPANPSNEHVSVRIGESMIDYENAFASLTEVSRIVYN